MSNSDIGDFYFGISNKKIYICFFEKGKNEYLNKVTFDIPDDLVNDLNFKIISDLLKVNIRKIEKKLGLFLNGGNISIQSKSNQSIKFSIKNIFDEKIIEKRVVTNLIQSEIQKFFNNDKKLFIAHIIINKYVIDDKVYNFLPTNIKFRKIILEIEFICLDKNLINKIKGLFNECKINLNKIVSYEYAKKFLDDSNDETMCLSAHKVLNGANQSEVYLQEEKSKKSNIFDTIFNFFD